MNRDFVVGSHIASLREQAGFKQNELAKRLEWSAALLSRVENGERALSLDELDIVLKGIGTPAAAKARQILSRKWTILPEPPPSDPDIDLLWTAEQAAQQIQALAERPDLKQYYEKRLTRYAEELKTVAGRVHNKRYNVAFEGNIADGKSTAICRAEGLEIPSSAAMPKPVLETGRGGITICEVHVRRGPEYGVIVEPCTEEEIRLHVSDFAKYLLGVRSSHVAEDDVESSTVGMSREIERALRSMTSLRRRRAEKKHDGSVIPASDDALDLAKTVPDVKALTVELLARMELHKRDRRDLWHSDLSGIPPLEWLQEQFERINNGRHPEFTLPKRIEIVVPTPILGQQSLSITLIDTQGIDDIAERADLEMHFDDPHTVIVICTKFDEAPSISARQLLTRAKEAGVRTLETQVALLVLPRPGDALAMKDNGYLVQDASEGCELKEDQMRLKLHPLGLPNLDIAFFNAAEDSPEKLRSFILKRIDVVREFHRSQLREIIEGANALMANYEKQVTLEIIRTASRRLTTWLQHNRGLADLPSAHVHDSLVQAVGTAHPRTIFASVVRRGEWKNLNYAHQISHGARRIAAQMTEAKVNGFKEIATNLLQDGELEPAHDLIRQTIRLLESGFEQLVRKAQLFGQSIHTNDMSTDAVFWQGCETEFGRGYRDRINIRNKKWFVEDHSGDSDVRVVSLIRETWGEALAPVEELLSQG